MDSLQQLLIFTRPKKREESTIADNSIQETPSKQTQKPESDRESMDWQQHDCKQD